MLVIAQKRSRNDVIRVHSILQTFSRNSFYLGVPVLIFFDDLPVFDEFDLVSLDEDAKFINNANSKTCPLDPIPFWVIKKFSSIFAPVFEFYDFEYYELYRIMVFSITFTPMIRILVSNFLRIIWINLLRILNAASITFVIGLIQTVKRTTLAKQRQLFLNLITTV